MNIISFIVQVPENSDIDVFAEHRAVWENLDKCSSSHWQSAANQHNLLKITCYKATSNL
jgi:hypothetical protein